MASVCRRPDGGGEECSTLDGQESRRGDQGSARGRRRPSSRGDRDRLSRLDLLSRSDLLSSADDETAVEREGGTGDDEHMRSGDADR